MSTGLTLEDAIPIEYGVRQSGQINSNVTWLYFKFNVTSGDRIIFQAYSDDDTMGYIYDQNGAQIGANDDSGEGYNPLINIIASYTGVMYAGIRAYNLGSEIPFEVSVDHNVIVERPGGSFEEAIYLPVNLTMDVSVSNAYPEIYLIMQCEVGARYEFTRSGQFDVSCNLFDGDQYYLMYADDDINGDLFLQFIAYTSIMYVRLRGYDLPTTDVATMTVRCTLVSSETTESQGQLRAVKFGDWKYGRMYDSRHDG